MLLALGTGVTLTGEDVVSIRVLGTGVVIT